MSPKVRQACVSKKRSRQRALVGSAPDGQTAGTDRPAPCPWLALDTGPDVPMQRLPRRPEERREAHIGRALGRVAPSMLLCSLSEAICFFLGEPGGPGGLGALGVGSPLPCAPLSRHHALRLTPAPSRGPDPHASCENLRLDLRLCDRS